MRGCEEGSSVDDPLCPHLSHRRPRAARRPRRAAGRVDVDVAQQHAALGMASYAEDGGAEAQAVCRQGGGEARDDDTVALGPSEAALALATREVVERRPRRGGVEGGAWLGLGLGLGARGGVRVRVGVTRG